MGKCVACRHRRCKTLGFDPGVQKIPWSRNWQPIPVFLLKKFHGQRSLVGYSPWGHKESDTTELLSTNTLKQMKKRPYAYFGEKHSRQREPQMQKPCNWNLSVLLEEQQKKKTQQKKPYVWGRMNKGGEK